MTEIIAIANQKGGVGKTTTAVNLAASLAVLKKRVLLIDLDAQGNATMGSGIQKNDLTYSATDVLLEDAPIEATILQTTSGYKIIGSNRDLAGIELSLSEKTRREYVLKDALDRVASAYDYVLIDCAPSLNLITVNALCAAGGVLIPMQCEYYALEGLADLSRTIEHINHSLNPDLQVCGVLRTIYDPRSTLTNDVSNELIAHFGEKVFETVIPRNIRLAEAPAHGLPILFYEKSSKGAIAYLNLAAELIKRRQKRQGKTT